MKQILILAAAAAAVIIATNAFGDSVKVGKGTKYHEAVTNGVTRCGWPIGVNQTNTTNAVDCKNCLIKKVRAK